MMGQLTKEEQSGAKNLEHTISNLMEKQNNTTTGEEAVLRKISNSWVLH